MTTKEIININISDWIKRLEAILRDETVSFNSIDEIVDTLVITYNLTSSQVGEIIIAAKQLGILPDDISWPEHKANLSLGGGYSSRIMIRRAVRMKQLENGREIEVRRVIGYSETEEDSQLLNVTHQADAQELESSHDTNVAQSALAPYALTDSDEGIKRSRDYLLSRVPRHIYNRLSELAGKEDLKVVARELKRKIDEMVKELS